MARTIDAANITALMSDAVSVVYLAELEYAAGTLRHHTRLGNLSAFGETFTGLGDLAKLRGGEESADTPGVKMTLSVAANDTNLAIALTQEYQYRTATVYQGLLNRDTRQFVADPFILFKGWMSQQRIMEDPEGPVIELDIVSKLVDWSRPREFRYNNATQQALYPGDRGLEQIENATLNSVKWGTEYFGNNPTD